MNMTPLSGSNKIVVVGGGAAGMMAAGMAAQAGAQVTLLEQNGRLGKKLLITGKGRYLDDISLPGMTHVAILRSPYAHANIRSIAPSWACRQPL